MSETVRCIDGIRIKGLPDGMHYTLLSNIEEKFGSGKGWVVTGTHNSIHAPQGTATKGYVRVRKLNAKTKDEKNGTIYIITFQEGHVFPPPCQSTSGGKRKSKTYKQKRVSKKRMTRRR